MAALLGASCSEDSSPSGTTSAPSTLVPATTATGTPDGTTPASIGASPAGVAIVSVDTGQVFDVYRGAEFQGLAHFVPGGDGVWTIDAMRFDLDGDPDQDARASLSATSSVEEARDGSLAYGAIGPDGKGYLRLESPDGTTASALGEVYLHPMISASGDVAVAWMRRDENAPLQLTMLGITGIKAVSEPIRASPHGPGVPSLSSSGRFALSSSAFSLDPFVLDRVSGETVRVPEGIETAWSPTRDVLALPSEEGGVVLRDFLLGEDLHIPSARYPLWFDDSGAFIYSDAIDGVTIWDANTGAIVEQQGGRLRTANIGALGGGPARLVVSVQDRFAILVESPPKTGIDDCVGTLAYHPALPQGASCVTNAVGAVWAPSGNTAAYLASSSTQRTWDLRLFDALSGTDRLLAPHVGDATDASRIHIEWNAAGSHLLIVWPWNPSGL